MTTHCPRDGAPTEPSASEGHVAYRCTQCEGLWLPGLELVALARERHVDLARLRAKLEEGRIGEAGFACPAGHPLVLSEYRTLELDWCPTCDGLWFDARELRRFCDLHPNAVTEGGLLVVAMMALAFVFAPEMDG